MGPIRLPISLSTSNYQQQLTIQHPNQEHIELQPIGNNSRIIYVQPINPPPIHNRNEFVNIINCQEQRTGSSNSSRYPIQLNNENLISITKVFALIGILTLFFFCLFFAQLYGLISEQNFLRYGYMFQNVRQ